MMVKIYIFIGISEDKMSAASASNVSLAALLRRELGLHTGCVRSVLDQQRAEASTISKSVQSPCCLVEPVLDKWDLKRIEDKIKEISSLLEKPGLNYKELSGELLKCCKAGWNYKTKVGVFVERSTVILGIRLRARDIFPNDPTYEEQQRKELDRILESNIRRLFYSIWHTENRFYKKI